jgi:outer membrane protein TolC
VFESRLITTLNALSVLLGRYPDPDLAGDSIKLPEIHPFDAGIPSGLLTNRPDIRAAFLRLEANDHRIGVAVSDRFPSFNLLGSYGGASDDVKTLLDSPNILWNIMVQATMPIIDGGRRRAEVDRTESVFRESLVVYHKTVLNAFKEVDDALINNKTTEERIRYLEDRVDATSGSVRLSLERYMQGLSDYIPILAAQGSHFEAQSLLLSARRQLISDRISLARALGGKWLDEEWNERASDYNTKGERS